MDLRAGLFLPCLLVLQWACDPCSGVARCSVGNYLAANGQVVNAATGDGIEGVRIDLVRVGGIALREDSVSIVTGSGGFWRVELAPSASGTLVVDVRVSPPNAAPYRIRSLQLATREHGGDANLNERWVSRPYFNRFAEFFIRGSVDDRAQRTIVEFRRTGGVVLQGPGLVDGVYTRTTDFAGRFRLFPSFDPDSILAAGDGSAIGDLTIRLGASLGSSVIRGAAIPQSYVYREPAFIVRYGVGPSLNYKGKLVDRATGAAMKGVSILFQRTGGIATSPTEFTATSEIDGSFSFPLFRALAAGVLDGRFIFRPTVIAPPETLQVQLPTFDADSAVLAPFAISAPRPVSAAVAPNGPVSAPLPHGIAGLLADYAR